MTDPDPAPKRLLLVDDDAHLRRSVSRLLRRAGWLVDEAGDGLEALELLATQPPALLLTDMRMPRMDGLQLIDAVRTRGLTLPIVVLSGYHDISVDDLLARGVTAVMEKPVGPSLLRDTLRDLVG